MKWEKVRLEDCCYSISDGDHQPPPKAQQGIPFVTISNINSMNQLDFSDTMFVPKEYYATVYKGNIIKNLIMDCQSYTKYRPNETTGGIFVSWRRKEELPTGA